MSNNPYQPPWANFSSDPPPGKMVAPPEPKHSGLGIASFAVALLAGVLAVAMIGVATYFAASLQEEFDDEAPQAIAVGLGIMGSLGLAVIGAGLGIAGVAQPNRNKVFAILGLTFNALLVLSVCGLMALGLFVG